MRSTPFDNMSSNSTQAHLGNPAPRPGVLDPPLLFPLKTMRPHSPLRRVGCAKSLRDKIRRAATNGHTQKQRHSNARSGPGRPSGAPRPDRACHCRNKGSHVIAARRRHHHRSLFSGLGPTLFLSLEKGGCGSGPHCGSPPSADNVAMAKSCRHDGVCHRLAPDAAASDPNPPARAALAARAVRSTGRTQPAAHRDVVDGGVACCGAGAQQAWRRAGANSVACLRDVCTIGVPRELASRKHMDMEHRQNRPNAGSRVDSPRLVRRENHTPAAPAPDATSVHSPLVGALGQPKLLRIAFRRTGPAGTGEEGVEVGVSVCVWRLVSRRRRQLQSARP